MSHSLFVVAVLIIIFGVILPVALKVAEDNRTSPYGSGAARRYLEALQMNAEMNPGEYAKHGVFEAPWVVFENIGSRNTDKWKSDMVAAVARVAPDNVSITNAGTCICMKQKS